MFFFETNLILRFWHQVIFQKDFSSSIVTPTTLNYQVRDGLACDRNSKDTKLKKKKSQITSPFYIAPSGSPIPSLLFLPSLPSLPQGGKRGLTPPTNTKKCQGVRGKRGSGVRM